MVSVEFKRDGRASADHIEGSSDIASECLFAPQVKDRRKRGMFSGWAPFLYRTDCLTLLTLCLHN